MENMGFSIRLAATELGASYGDFTMIKRISDGGTWPAYSGAIVTCSTITIPPGLGGAAMDKAEPCSNGG